MTVGSTSVAKGYALGSGMGHPSLMCAVKCRGIALIMQSYLVGNGCRLFGTVWWRYLVRGMCLVMGMLSHGMRRHQSVFIHALWGFQLGHRLSVSVGVAGLVMGCHQGSSLVSRAVCVW